MYILFLWNRGLYARNLAVCLPLKQPDITVSVAWITVAEREYPYGFRQNAHEKGHRKALSPFSFPHCRNAMDCHERTLPIIDILLHVKAVLIKLRTGAIYRFITITSIDRCEV